MADPLADGKVFDVGSTQALTGNKRYRIIDVSQPMSKRATV